MVTFTFVCKEDGGSWNAKQVLTVFLSSTLELGLLPKQIFHLCPNCLMPGACRLQERIMSSQQRLPTSPAFKKSCTSWP